MKPHPLLVLTLLPFLVAAGDLPPLVIPEGVGVNIHFTRGHQKDLDLIAAAGCRFIRMDFSWGGTERKKGEYQWADYDELTANLEKRGLRAIYILDYSNGLYEDAITSRDPISGRERRDIAAPRKPESIAAFARWAGAAAAHLKGRRIIWEIWNEPNIGFWKPQPNVTNYAALVEATCQAVRAADPAATIIAPATSEFPWSFLEPLFQRGALQHLDAVSVHPYRNYSRGPETAGDDYRRLRGLIERYAPPGKSALPIISGEWGYATHAKGGVSLETQAAFLVRQQLANLYHQVPISIWYDWKNDGTDPNYNENNFGTVTYELDPKPSYRALTTLTTTLAGCRIARRLETERADDWLLLCVSSNGQQKIAAWTTGEAHEVALPFHLSPGNEVTLIDSRGARVELRGRQLRLEAAPGYLELRRPEPALQAAAAWRTGDAATLVVAGQTSGLRVPVEVSNPFERPAQVTVRLGGLPGQAELVEKKALRPHERSTCTLTTRIAQRWPEQFAPRLSVEYLVQGTPRDSTLGVSSEMLAFALANPLRLTVAPLVPGLRLRIENPSGTEFRGELLFAGKKQAIHLSRGQAEVALTLSRPADPIGARLTLRDSQGETAGEVPLPLWRALTLGNVQATLDGDARIPAQATLVATNAPGENAPSPNAYRLDYNFAPGWRFVRCTTEKATGISGRPVALGMWIYGDQSGNALRMRVTDASGQTFQPNGPALDWRGWRWITFDLANLKHAGHWGGANDGTVHGALRLDSPLLLDGSRHKTEGTIYFTGLHWIHHDSAVR